MTPSSPDPGENVPSPELYLADAMPPRPTYRWYHKLFAVLLATACLIIGIFLLIFPWTPAWDNNYFAGLSATWQHWWRNLYVRGAISGIGIVNLYISLVEVFRLKRFSQR